MRLYVLHVVESSKLFFSKVREFVPPYDRTYVRQTISRATHIGDRTGQDRTWIMKKCYGDCFWLEKLFYNTDIN